MEGATKEMRFAMHEEKKDELIPQPTILDNGDGYLKKEIFDKYYKEDYRKKGFFKYEDTFVRRPTEQHKDVVQPYWPLEEVVVKKEESA